jgi:D-alanyl-D-alanine carboxypeptidase
MHARLTSVAAALALLAILVIRPAIGPIGARGMGPLPACRYDDLLTSPRSYDDWSITLVDTLLSVPKSYVPPDLASVSEAGLPGDGRVRSVVIDDLRAMRVAAAAAGAAFGVESAYRSYAEQQQVFDSWVKQFGYARAVMTLARPGHSEHQLGVAIDFRSDAAGAAGSGNFGSTAAGEWMAGHAWEYGFVLSYPKDSTALTCYASEPWHFRYVGRKLAANIQASGLTLRAFLWANFTTTVVPQPITSSGPTIAPLPTAGPTPSPSAPTEPSPTALAALPTATAITVAGTVDPTAIASDATGPIDPAVAAGAQPALVLIAGMTFVLIIGGGLLAARRRRPGRGQ